MKPNFRTCPQCSTRNRLDKEFCVKCGEPLEGVRAGDSSADKQGRPGIFVSQGGGDADQSPLVPLALVLLTLGVALAALQTVRRVEEPATPPLGAAPQVQASIPSSTPLPPGPGVQAYASGQNALRGGDLVSAVRFFREAVAAANLAEFHFALGQALERSGPPGQEFLTEYEVASGLEPSNVRYVSDWARALNRAGRNADALRAYEKALQLDPDNSANNRDIAKQIGRAHI